MQHSQLMTDIWLKKKKLKLFLTHYLNKLHLPLIFKLILTCIFLVFRYPSEFVTWGLQASHPGKKNFRIDAITAITILCHLLVWQKNTVQYALSQQYIFQIIIHKTFFTIRLFLYAVPHSVEFHIAQLW